MTPRALDLVVAGGRVVTSTEVLDAAIVRTSDDGRYPSDHFPVTARIRLRPAGR